MSFLSVFSIGTLLGVVVSPAEPPEGLEKPTLIRWANASEMSIDDRQDAEFRLQIAPAVSLLSPVSGTVTHQTCLAGLTLASGASNFSVDGEPLLNVASEVPFWRTLNPGDEGIDAKALKGSLAALGYEVSADSEWDTSAARSYASALTNIGRTTLPRSGTFDPATSIWLPPGLGPLESCASTLGASISFGAPLGILPPQLISAGFESFNAEAIDGSRVISIGSKEFAFNISEPIVESEALAAIASLAEYAELEEGQERLSLSTRLVEGVRATTVPPAALHDVDGNSACITLKDGTSLSVTILTSILGSTVLNEGESIAGKEIALLEQDQTTCG
ncbi:hypothetical protein E3T39_15605 [Cryobacterium suzukii]|uniref:Peptidoglycan-binding protein n=1 Tax=Cryobacterium suzukii TaxID=1259198 RepID=A0A4R9ABW6_9MICO|nr:hypothetical protein [Cryobacterium suzukii]TFD56761.1 hypothetical protein E3T39_15605 [Cryobacterium suzukii]